MLMLARVAIMWLCVARRARDAANFQKKESPSGSLFLVILGQCPVECCSFEKYFLILYCYWINSRHIESVFASILVENVEVF